MTQSKRFEQVSVETKANIYFDGKVVSHSVWFGDGKKKTLGLIYPGTFNFKTGAGERMEIVAGRCRVCIAGASDWLVIAAGESFDVPTNSFFDIEVKDGIAEYICSFLA